MLKLRFLDIFSNFYFLAKIFVDTFVAKKDNTIHWKVAFLDGGHEHLVGDKRSPRCNLRIRRLRHGNWRRAHHLCTALWNRNYFLRFRFRFLLLKSYGSDFWNSYGSGSGSYFWKVTVPVPVPSPYLDHKKQIFQEKFWNFFCLFT